MGLLVKALFHKENHVPALDIEQAEKGRMSALPVHLKEGYAYFNFYSNNALNNQAFFYNWTE